MRHEFLIVLGVLAVLFVAILWLWEWWIERPRRAEMAKKTYPPSKFETALAELSDRARRKKSHEGSCDVR